MNMTRLHRWHHHPAVRSGDQLTRGERAADAMRNTMGSWPFVFSFLGFMAIWMVLNGIAWIDHWDPYPWILLNLVLSMMGGMQGAVIIIADKRGQQIAAELAQHDYEVNQKALAGITAAQEALAAQVEHLTAIAETAGGTRQLAAAIADSLGIDPETDQAKLPRPRS